MWLGQRRRGKEDDDDNGGAEGAKNVEVGKILDDDDHDKGSQASHVRSLGFQSQKALADRT